MSKRARPAGGMRSRLALASLLTLMGGVARAAPSDPSFRTRTGRLEPTMATLQEAAVREERSEMARAATRLGFARLTDVLIAARSGRARPAEAKLALNAAAALSGSARLLPDVIPLLTDADAGLAEVAARTVGAMLDGAELGSLADWDVPPDATRSACAALLRQARDTGRPTDVRVTAIESLASAPACPSPGSTLLSDGDPEVRRAAVLTASARGRNIADLRPMLGDREPAVAAAAGARLCSALGTARPDPGLATAARNLATASAVAPEDSVELLGCLAASGAPGDRQVLERLREGGSPSLRRRATELLR